MRIYEPKKLIKGYKLGLKNGFANADLFAVPRHKLPCIVKLNDRQEEVDLERYYVLEQEFEDKFGRDRTYVLRYFEYKEVFRTPIAEAMAEMFEKGNNNE
jgi:hypothetical protein